MKNVNSNELRKCITLTKARFEDIISNILGKDVNIFYDNGVYFESENNEDEGISSLEILAALSKYFDVKIISVHTNNSSCYPMILMTYVE